MASRNFIARHWRGELPLPVSYWLIGLLTNVVVLVVATGLTAILTPQASFNPVNVLLALTLIWLIVGVASVWQLVGVWRSATKYQERKASEQRSGFWGGFAKAVVILGAIRVVFEFGTSAIPQLSEAGQMAFLDDPSIPAYELRLMNDGQEVEITGGVKYGLTDEFQTLLAANPQLHVVHLNSVGGRIGEAIKLYNVIQAHDLHTYSSNECVSACTIIFAAGKERWIRPYTKLGYHAGAFPGLDEGLDDDSRQVYLRAGLSHDFVRRALATSNSDMWYPTVQELYDGRAITGIVANDAQFGLDADELALRHELPEMNRGLPRQIDEVTQLRAIELVGREFTYVYHVDIANEVEDQAAKELSESVSREVCSSEDMRPSMRDYSLTYRYAYSRPDGSPLFAFTVDDEACRKLGL